MPAQPLLAPANLTLPCLPDQPSPDRTMSSHACFTSLCPTTPRLAKPALPYRTRSFLVMPALPEITPTNHAIPHLPYQTQPLQNAPCRTLPARPNHALSGRTAPHRTVPAKLYRIKPERARPGLVGPHLPHHTNPRQILALSRLALSAHPSQSRETKAPCCFLPKTNPSPFQRCS